MKRKSKVILYNIVVSAALIVGIVWVANRFVHLGPVEWTDNAYVHQHITPVNSRVQGFVREVRFEEYGRVQKGDTLVIIDDSEHRLAVARAEAALADAHAGLAASAMGTAALESSVGASDATLAEARASLANAVREDERHEALLQRNAVTRQLYDRVHTARLAAEARVEALEKAMKSTALTRNQQEHRAEQAEAAIRLAQTQLDLACLNLSYTVILAPCDGVMGKKDVQPGQLIQQGMKVADVVDGSRRWVVANFRERQIKHITPGCKVEMTVDALPGHKFTGTVETVADATGSAAANIPVDNATGNFVKVQQRIPVRIAFDADVDSAIMACLRAGMSVEAKVRY